VLDRLKQGVRIANYGDHHNAMGKWLNELEPIGDDRMSTCVRCGMLRRMTLSLVDPEMELLSGRYYIGYSTDKKRNAPYVLSVSPVDYQWLCTRCNILEGQPLLRHNAVHILAHHDLFGTPDAIPRRVYAEWSARTGGPTRSPGRRAGVVA
jgi:hypothetical protein